MGLGDRHVVLAVFAVVTAWYARKAFREQAKEVSDQAEMLKLQAEEFMQLAADREREALERRRAQAVKVFMWLTMRTGATGESEVTFNVRNTSQQPIYKLTVAYRPISATDATDGGIGETLMPGEGYAPTVPYRDITDILSLKPGHFVATFRDSAGVWWRMRPAGQPEELPPPRPPEPEADNTTTPETVPPDAG